MDYSPIITVDIYHQIINNSEIGLINHQLSDSELGHHLAEILRAAVWGQGVVSWLKPWFSSRVFDQFQWFFVVKEAEFLTF